MRTLHVAVREARLCIGRILLTCGLPSGAVHGVQECVLLSQSLQLGGFRALLENPAALDWTAYRSARFELGADGTLAVDGGGVHAWLLLPALTDLAVDLARRNGSARVKVSNVAGASELPVASALAKRYGATGEVSGTLVVMHNASRPRTAAQWDPLLDAAMRHGYDVEESLWRAVHELSNGALAPDSPGSRRHAGPVVLADDGRLLGRVPQDDDFDMNMLKKVAP
jgi:hypothetical protein